MRSLTARAGGLGLAIAAAVLLAVGPSSSLAASTAKVSCDSNAFVTAFTNANTAGSGKLKLASDCVYLIGAALPTVTGPSSPRGTARSGSVARRQRAAWRRISEGSR